MCAKILEIMFSVLRPTAENNKLLSGQGFLLISNLLERLPPSHVNMATLDVLIAQSRKASWRPSWHDNLMIHFLCNFRPVYYTHLTLPTTLPVGISRHAGRTKKKPTMKKQSREKGMCSTLAGIVGILVMNLVGERDPQIIPGGRCGAAAKV